MSFPNILTFFRILLIPTFATAFLYGKHPLALGVFILAELTDALDGFLARFKAQQTRLGSFLDPVADKLLLLTAFALLGLSQEVPLWCLILVYSREIIVVGGWIIRYLLTRSSTVVSSLLGKAMTLMQAVAVTALLLNRYVSLPYNLTAGLLYVAMALTAFSGLDYLYRGLKELEPRTSK